MKIEKFKKEDIETVFKEKNIQFPLEEFIQALTQKELARQKAYEEELAIEAAKPESFEIYKEAILEAPTPGTRVEDLIISAVKNNDYYDLFYDSDGMDDDGEDATVYFKVGDKFYKVEIHCEADWVGDWSVRKNLPGNVNVESIKEVSVYTVRKDEGDYILIDIPKK